MADEEVSCGCCSSSIKFNFSRKLVIYFSVLNILIGGAVTQSSFLIKNESNKIIDDTAILPSVFIGSSTVSSTSSPTATSIIDISDSRKDSSSTFSKFHGSTVLFPGSVSSSLLESQSSSTFVISSAKIIALSTPISMQTETPSAPIQIETTNIIPTPSVENNGSSTVLATVINSPSASQVNISSSVESSSTTTIQSNNISSSISPTSPTPSNSSILSTSIEPSQNISSSTNFVNVSSTNFASLILPSCYIITTTEVICSKLSTIVSSSNLPNASDISSNEILQNSTIQPTMMSTEALSTSQNITSSQLPTTMLSSTQSIEPSASSSSLIVSSSIVNASTLIPSVHVCDIVASNFTVALNNYTSCVLLNLKPMEVCQKCFEQYETMKIYHRKIYHDCGKHLIGRYNSQYQVISGLFEIQQRSWNSLECESELLLFSLQFLPLKNFLE